MRIQPIISRLEAKLDDSEKRRLINLAAGLNKTASERSLIAFVEGLIETALKLGVGNEAIRTNG